MELRWSRSEARTAPKGRAEATAGRAQFLYQEINISGTWKIKKGTLEIIVLY